MPVLPHRVVLQTIQIVMTLMERSIQVLLKSVWTELIQIVTPLTLSVRVMELYLMMTLQLQEQVPEIVWGKHFLMVETSQGLQLQISYWVLDGMVLKTVPCMFLQGQTP